MEKLYRTDYIGEYFTHSRSQTSQLVVEDREWIPNTIPAFSHTGNAVVIGNGPSRNALPLHYLMNHGGGHKGKMKLTTYGCNALYRDASPQFLVVTGKAIAKEVADSGYADENVVLSHPDIITQHPGKFHLIPFDQYWNAGCVATWMACFDGHTKVYLYGMDNQPQTGINLNVYADTAGYDSTTYRVNDESWVSTMVSIFNAYSDVEFVWVNPTIMPESWRYATNLRQITDRQFVYESDLGA